MFKFTVITSNIRFDNPADGEHDWHNRRKLLACAINGYHPDIIGTQEGWQPQLKDLEGLLQGLKIVEENRQWIDDRMYPSIYYRPSKFKLIHSGDIWLSETPYIAASKSFGSAFPRVCTWAILEARANNKKFFVVNAHLDHLKTNTRQEQINVLINEINRLRSDYPVILTGDFNESPFEQVRSIINQRIPELIDPWLEHKHEECESHHSFKGQREDGSRIDWILCSKDKLKCEEILMHKEESDGIYPSDHFPVVATISAK
ncbi:endonuclease/exonuclease/phosphatase family protein [Halobacteriovorax sp. BALOs_7]|uniref:Endonuclease/exonuclease/phosphatase family protein n=1 Tax=Halobacteriovorax vibrionivorans TaxID=2152716 RepID=A0ABY0IGL4_9BACT|nr:MULTISPECIES: endonuclease/exonuclease/phosphatase family protein [Halobacteriovorax]AYF43335.1 endonuclease/exonuclease/phosphatase family protein [Halobacteriovorax sp. BALOs_7]RZF22091.1 endonuclease/exonuclease/phosphatase family protein [Halobacteriovorax vibrionivorans]TGD46948.1 endonuclease/exonuclease/phosphatase family protein [Halobacteriovorax sp. Y22]